MADIPWELFTEILSLLPVETLLRFRSISKSIRTLIDSPYFNNLHLQNSLNFNLILRNHSDFYQIDFPNLTTCFEVNLPITLYNTSINLLLRSCNGMLCISIGVNKLYGTLTPVNIGLSLISLSVPALKDTKATN